MERFWLVLITMCLFACTENHELNSDSSASCSDFEAAQIGTVSVTIDGSDVVVNWTEDLSHLADQLEVSLAGPSSVEAQATKPSSFKGLATGSWEATVAYSKASCQSVTDSRSFTVDPSVDCSSWNAQSVGTVTVTQSGADGASVNWSGSISGQDSFEVSLSGATTSGPVVDTKPSSFSNLNPGSHTATVVYKKSGCSDLTDTGSYSAPVSLSAHLYPVLSVKCSSCHAPPTGSNGFTYGNNATELYSNLQENWTRSCTPAASNSERVDVTLDPPTPTGSYFYRKVATSECGTSMATQGGLTSTEVGYILDWISQGANNN